jgi:hypothetical protein
MKNFFAIVISVVCFSCGRGPNLNNFNKSESREFPHGVVFHRTSGSVVTVNDSDGFGLVDGNILGAFYSAKDGALYVKYKPLLSEKGVGIFHAKIILETKKIIPMHNVSESLEREMKPIESYL